MADREGLLEECDAFIAEHKAKADSNERRARWATALLVTSTSAIPVFIIASTQTLGFLFGKLVPAVLAATGAGLAALLQFERPHERWSLYRRYQRLFEAERMLYEQKTGPYAGEAPDRGFSEWLARQRIAVHDEWASLVPASSEITKVTRADGPGGR